MPSSPSSTKIGEHIRIQRSRNHGNLPTNSSDDERSAIVPKPSRVCKSAMKHLIPKPSRVCKSAMSSFYILPTTSNETTRKKPNSFSQTASFLGLGCTTSASQQISVPAVIRSSADWDATKSKTKKSMKNINNGGSIKILSEASSSSSVGFNCAVTCGPGVGFSTDAVDGGSIDPVDSNLPRRNIPFRRKIDGDKTNSNSNHREASSVLPRRSLNQELDTNFDSVSTFLTSRAEQTDRYQRHLRQPYPDGLAEMMMMQNGFVMGGRLSLHDNFRGMRLNVDNMTYEQLLELGDRIGYVNTGLQEKQIKFCLRKVKPVRLSTLLEDRKCSICQDEYGTRDEVGKLRCGHRFHINCVKQWLVRKNSCPVCKTTPYDKS